MYDAQLDAGLRIYRVYGVREAFQSVDAGDEDVVQAAILQFCQHIQPELRAFIFGQPHTQQFFLAFDVDAQSQKHGFIDDATVLPDLKDNTVKVNNRIDGIQWPVLPLNNLLHDGVSDF
ncbi:Uncharacterised protein [Acinetobacter baumannii]|nr:Uncharacterised protein [Acinetobacter baumannii]